MVDDQLLLVDEVAELLRVRPSTVREWLRRGELQGFRAGGTRTGWRVQRSDVQRFIDEQKRRSRAVN